MKVRIALLSSVLTLVSDSPDANAARNLVLQWILDEASRTGGNKHRIRRNLIWSNHVRGDDATSKFAHLVWDAAANQNHDPLVNTVRATDDEQALRDHLMSLAAPPPLTSAAWIEEQVTHHDLDRKLTGILLRRAHMEYSELRSLVGLWLARWGAEGTFDEVLAAEGTVRTRVLVQWLRRKIRSHHFRRGTEPVERMFGARTECEVEHRRQQDDPTWITRGAEYMDNDACRTAALYDEDGVEIGVEFIDSSETPEEAVSRKRDTAAEVSRLRKIVHNNAGKAGDRFVRFYDLMAEGHSLEHIALIEGVSDNRAKKITGEIRVGLRDSIDRSRAAEVILRAIEDEPFTTADEIGTDLQIEADVVAECLRDLCSTGAVTEVPGQSYILTRNL